MGTQRAGALMVVLYVVAGLGGAICAL